MAPTNLIHKCMFCKSELIKINPGRSLVLGCNECPKPIGRKDSYMWGYKCIVSSKGDSEVLYVYYSDINKWLEIYYDEEHMIVRDHYDEGSIRIDYIINIENFTEQDMMEKINTWLLLQ